MSLFTYDVYVANATSKEGVRVPVPAMIYRLLSFSKVGRAVPFTQASRDLSGLRNQISDARKLVLGNETAQQTNNLIDFHKLNPSQASSTRLWCCPMREHGNYVIF